jgi:nucleotide-binding universal stress UspA family protein
MVFQQPAYQHAIHDFRTARQRAALQDVLARLTGKSTGLLSYEEVAQKLKLAERSNRGLQQIPVNAIIGSVGRYADFTRTFLPRQRNDEQRWARVKALAADPKAGWPPIEVYKVGEAYFVLDGNHRVSIARQEGLDTIEAYVTEVRTRVPLTPDTQPDDLIVKSEYAAFLDRTRLADLRPNVDLSMTAPGQYVKLEQQIEYLRYLAKVEQGKEIPFDEAAAIWYDDVYLPVETAIRERGMLHWFPDRTATDLYVWVSEYRLALEQELGAEIRPEAALTDLAVKKDSRAGSTENKPGSWRTARMVDRYTENLFKEILVPLSGGEECWDAAEQAVMVAAREDARLYGLHIVDSEDEKHTPQVATIQARFEEICQQAGVKENFLVESGDIPKKICERALLTDLVILNTLHPPPEGLGGLGSGLRTIIARCARPILAVCCNVCTMDKALLAYDGSPKAREALFVATYLAEQWMTSLTVMAITEGSRVTDSVLDDAQAYLDLHEIQAEFITASGPISLLHDVMDERGTNLLLMGGYSLSALEELLQGSAVDSMLRENHCPIFICR